MIKTILFDLDGTLLHLEQDAFLHAYFKRIALYFAERGYDPVRFTEAMKKSVYVMLNNDGKMRNDALFWQTFPKMFGDKRMLEEMPAFERFYHTAFGDMKPYCKEKAGAAEALRRLREMGFQLVLASNSVYPPIAYERRMGWCGLSSELFDFMTTYENMHYCKPSVGYFLEAADVMGVSPEECLMVGNDVSDDMPARACGMRVFLMTDSLLINPNGEDLTVYPQGGLAEMMKYIEENR